MNASLPASVVNFLAAPSRSAAEALAPLALRHWNRKRHWLVVSGLALYFWDELRRNSWHDVLPREIATWLADLWEASGQRIRELTTDLLQLNEMFSALQLPYANWKGLAASPDFCPDPRLRMQLDFDFVIEPGSENIFGAALEQSGYHLVGVEDREFQYENMPGTLYSFEQIFRPKPQRKVELHYDAVGDFSGFPQPSLDSVLTRRITESRGGVAFPHLCPADAFLAACFHVGRHLFAGWGRLDWLLEIRHFAVHHAANAALWAEVRARTAACPHSASMAALACELTQRLFGWPEGHAWRWAPLAAHAERWMRLHARDWALADFPGRKNYLLLARGFLEPARWQEFERGRLLPARTPPRPARTAPPASRTQSWRWQVRFVRTRLRFHLLEGARYLLQKRAWEHGRAS